MQRPSIAPSSSGVGTAAQHAVPTPAGALLVNLPPVQHRTFATTPAFDWLVEKPLLDARRGSP